LSALFLAIYFIIFPCKAFEIFHPAFKALYFYFTDIVSDQNRYSEQSIRNMIRDYAKMSAVIQYILYLVVLIVLAIPLGTYIKKVMNGEKTFLSKILTPCESAVYKVMRVKKDEQMNRKKYAVSVLIFSGIGLIFLFLLQILQGVLPGNPNAFTNLIEMLSILLIPAALCFTFGKAIKNKKQGVAIFMAIKRNGKMNLNFAPETSFIPGDTILVLGDTKNI
jgi:potassium-transporting ATPase A chain